MKFIAPLLLRTVVVVALLATAVSSCGGDSSDDSTMVVVATTTVLGDVASNVVGSDGVVEVLLPIGADAHDYQASAQQIASLQTADLVIANGLGLEEGLEDVLAAAAADGANILSVGEFLNPIPFGATASEDHDQEEDEEEGHEEEGHEDEGHEDDGHGHNEDPHVWLDPIRMAEASRIIATELALIQPDIDWMANATTYSEQLATADAAIDEILSSVPQGQRKLVANHYSLGYFADRYGFSVIGTVIPGGSTLGEPSSADLADLVSKIETENVPAIFAETTEPAALAQAVASELGNEIQVVDLYTGSLGGPGSGAETLIDMLTTNARLIAEALS